MKKKRIGGLPNILTIFRIAISPVFLVLFLNSKITAGLIVFIVAALTDLVDGMIAKCRKQKTKFGEFLDPMADKFMVVLAVIALLVKFNFPLWGLWILSRDVISLYGSFLVYKKQKGSWKAGQLGKATTFLQVVTIIAFIIDYTFKNHLLIMTIIISIITAITYFIRGVKITKSSK